MLPASEDGQPGQLDQDGDDATTQLLPDPSLEPQEADPGTRSVLVRLYLSHFMSTWSSRMFEFGAVLFLASIFPGTLLYASVYALVRSLSASLLSSWLGFHADRLNRLTILRFSIVWQRIPVALSCGCFILLLSADGPGLVASLFPLVVILACVEKLASVANMVAIERDWVIVISESLQIPRDQLNASMRRIDLCCKLLAPVFISLVDSLSTKAAIWTVIGLNASWVTIEYVAIAQVYKAVPALARAEISAENAPETSNTQSLYRKVSNFVRNMATPWREYAASSAFVPSFALSLLYFTVLSFGAQMVTYLLYAGFSPLDVSYMRIGAVTSEIAGTWAAPLAMNRVGPIRSGLWFINWQFGCLASAAALFIFLDSSSRFVALGLVIGVALSRLGLWGFDLSAQFIIQERTNPESRARFSSTEAALQNIFELLSFASTIVFPQPEKFKYPVLISYCAVAVAAVSYAGFVRKERGHLLHMSACLRGDKLRLAKLRSSTHRNDGYESLA